MALTKSAQTHNERIVLVLDNHPSHKTQLVRGAAEALNIELLFLPPYSPELNSIESLWSVFKLNLKNRLAQSAKVVLSQDDFRGLLRECIRYVRPEQQQRAAQLNNIDFIYRALGELLDPTVLESKEELERRVRLELGQPLPVAGLASPLAGSWEALTPLAGSPWHSVKGDPYSPPVSPIPSLGSDSPRSAASVVTISKMLR